MHDIMLASVDPRPTLSPSKRAASVTRIFHTGDGNMLHSLGANPGAINL